MSREPSPCVLLVDDDADICETLHVALEHYGYHVVTCGDGAEALVKLRAGLHPDVILLDLMMPHMSGARFREEQSHDERLRDIPVVVMSGGRDVERIASRLGVAWLPKPVNLSTLLAAVGRAIHAG